MTYWGAYAYIFRSKQGTKNLLMQSLGMLIPLVGPIVVLGYMRDVFLDLHHDPKAPCRMFSFDRFSDYLTRGLWPFLVSLVAGFVLVPVVWAMMFVAFVMITALHLNGGEVALVYGGFGLIYFVIATLYQMFVNPLALRALLMQDFGPAFNWAFVKDYVGKMWPQLLLKQLFLIVTSLPLIVLGLLACYFGIFAAMALISMAGWILQFQIYEEYLKKGGIEIPIKPIPGAGLTGGFEVGMTPGQ